MTKREKTVALIIRRLNQRRLRDITMSNADLIIYDNPNRFYQTYRLANWYLPGLISNLTHHKLSLKSVLVALESARFQLLKVNTEARLNGKYGVSTRLINQMIRYYQRSYANWSANNEDKIVKSKWKSEANRYHWDSAYRQKMNQRINNFENPKLPF